MCYFMVASLILRYERAFELDFMCSLVVVYYHFICMKSGILLVIFFVVSLSYVGVQSLRGISKALEDLRGVRI
jgi:hypothetical protein